jgi:hypothetical protein
VPEELASLAARPAPPPAGRLYRPSVVSWINYIL